MALMNGREPLRHKRENGFIVGSYPYKEKGLLPVIEKRLRD